MVEISGVAFGLGGGWHGGVGRGILIWLRRTVEGDNFSHD
jgi:hypothetical protein